MRRWWNRMLWRIGWVDGGRLWNGKPTWQRLTVDFKTGEQVRYVLRRDGDPWIWSHWLETHRWDGSLTLLSSSSPGSDVDIQARVEETG